MRSHLLIIGLNGCSIQKDISYDNKFDCSPYFLHYLSQAIRSFVEVIDILGVEFYEE